MSIYKRLKLYRLKTACGIVAEAWKQSAELAAQFHVKRNRVVSFLDIVYSHFRYGADFYNYVSFHFYKLTPKARSEYITFEKSKKLMFLFDKPAIERFLDKAEFNRIFANYVHRDWIDTREVSIEQIKDFVARHEVAIVKPFNASLGRGIFKLRDGDREKFEQLHGDLMDGHHYIIEQVVNNATEIKALNPSALNTVRMVTVLDAQGKMHLLASIIRMGTTDACIDNAKGGGIACSIDPVTGCINSIGRDLQGNEFETHPRTGIQLRGYQLPRWNEVLEFTRNLSQVLPEARYVGWDVAIADDGIEVIEGNIPPGENITQLFASHGLYSEIINLY